MTMQLRLADNPDPDLDGMFGDCKGREVGYPKRRLVKPCADGRKIEEVLYDDHVQLHMHGERLIFNDLIIEIKEHDDPSKFDGHSKGIHVFSERYPVFFHGYTFGDGLAVGNRFEKLG